MSRRRTDLGRTTRERDDYTVVRCGRDDCRWLWVHEDLAADDAASCPRCGSTFDEPTLDAVYATDEHDDAVGVRAAQLAKDADDLERYDTEYPAIDEQIDQAEARIEATTATPALDGPAVPLDSDYSPWAAGHVDITPFSSAEQAAVDARAKAHLQRRSPATTDAGEAATPPLPVDVDDRPGISVRRDGDQLDIAPDVELTNLGPKRSEWLPELLRALVDETDGIAPALQAMHDLLAERAPEDLDADRTRAGTTDVIDDVLARPDATASTSAAVEEAAVYLGALATHTVRDGTTLDERDDRTTAALTRLATGTGAFNAGLGALVRGPVALQQASDRDPATIRVRFDAAAWEDAGRKTALRALATLSTLAVGYHVELVITSPGLEDLLRRRWTQWADANLRLTDGRDWDAILQGLADDSERVDRTLAAQDAVDALPSGSLKVDLLANLTQGRPRTVKQLREDPDVEAADGSIDRYLGELEDLLCVYIEPAHPSNRVHLTDVGEIVQDNIGADGRTLTDPVQTTLADLTETRNSSVSAVYGTGGGREGGEDCPAGDRTPDRDRPEAVVAATGDADDHDAYVQWLGSSTPDDDNWLLHRRYMAAARDAAVTTVDDVEMLRLEDGRVGILSGPWDDGEDDVLCMVEWGGPLATLGRIAATLLNRRAWARILTQERLGRDLETLSASVVEDLDESVGDVIRYGRQIGWFSEDDETYDGLKDRLEAVRVALLERLGELATSDDYEARGELMRSLHGLIASVTQLYYAAGLDLVIHVRVPDLGDIERDEQRTRDLADLFAHLVPKQTAYRHHSGYRMLLEDRENKLRQRLAYSDDVDPDDPEMDWTARLVLAGDRASAFRQPIAAAISRELRQARDDVQAGEETTAVMELPVADGNTVRAATDIVEQVAERKGYILGSGRGGPPTPREVARLLTRVLSTGRRHADADRPDGRVNPMVVAETLLRMGRRDVTEYLKVHDLEHGLAALPETRFLPYVTPSERDIVRALLAADEPLGRSEIIAEEHADIGSRSYDKYIGGLRGLGIVEEAEVDGRTAWTASLAPWWTAFRQRDGSPTAELPDEDLADPSERDLVAAFLERARDLAPGSCGPPTLPAEPLSAADLYDAADVARRWRPFVLMGLPITSLSTPPPAADELVTTVRQGSPPAVQPGEQAALTAD